MVICTSCACAVFARLPAALTLIIDSLHLDLERPISIKHYLVNANLLCFHLSANTMRRTCFPLDLETLSTTISHK